MIISDFCLLDVTVRLLATLTNLRGHFSPIRELASSPQVGYLNYDVESALSHHLAELLEWNQDSIYLLVCVDDVLFLFGRVPCSVHQA